MKAKYDVVELSEKIIELSNSLELSITHLQLQKVLYYVQGEFMKNFGYKAFGDQIECWPYGPVVKRIWDIYNVYGRRPLKSSKASLVIGEQEKKVIVDILLNKLRMNVWDLVDATHDELPWMNANQKNELIISDMDMEKFFCQ